MFGSGGSGAFLYGAKTPQDDGPAITFIQAMR